MPRRWPAVDNPCQGRTSGPTPRVRGPCQGLASGRNKRTLPDNCVVPNNRTKGSHEPAATATHPRTRKALKRPRHGMQRGPSQVTAKRASRASHETCLSRTVRVYRIRWASEAELHAFTRGTSMAKRQRDPLGVYVRPYVRLRFGRLERVRDHWRPYPYSQFRLFD